MNIQYIQHSIFTIHTAMYWQKNHKSDEDLEKILEENTANKALIQNSRDKKQDMVNFFESMKNSDTTQESKMREVLYGGRSDMKRHYRVDESLYGTEEGARLAKEAQEGSSGSGGEKGDQGSQGEGEVGGEKRKKRRKKGKRKKKKKVDDDHDDTPSSESSETSKENSERQRQGIMNKGVVATGAAGTIALAALIFLGGGGGKRSR